MISELFNAIPDTVAQLGLALALGLLVGLQREWAEKEVAGIRTFALITLLGALAGQIGPAAVGPGLLGLAAIFFVANMRQRESEDRQAPPAMGTTTEIAGLLMFVVGAALASGYRTEAVCVAGTTAVLLYLKERLHEMVGNIEKADIRAIIQFALISLVVLPLLPDQAYGPYNVLNPFQIWLLVVLIVAISLVAYVIFKLMDPRLGSLMGGLLGGLISSTATTASYARRAADGKKAQTALAATVVIISSAVVFGRVLIEVAIVAPQTLSTLAPPLLIMGLWMTVVAAGAFLITPHDEAEVAAHENPAQLKSALLFGASFAVVLLAVAAARDHFGAEGMYVVAGLAGLTKMDAITLSTASLVADGNLAADTGWRMIIVASMTNMVFKAGIAGSLGGRRLLARLAVLFGLGIGGGVMLLWLWPA
ncbi:MAG: DUF4010 domain-containing protein [Phycisphaeraceae bacterium]|nr:DUF4010 domain-containing protein [Phycisphaeraceae bacterium]